MKVFRMALTGFTAQSIFYGACTIINAMNEFVFFEGFECTVQGNFVHFVKLLFQIG